MNVQLYAYDKGTRYELDLYQEQPIKITLSAEEITSPAQINSAFTRQFRIPATNNNSRFFEYWYLAGVIDFDVTQKVTAEIHVDGLLYRTGQLRLVAAYDNGTADRVDFEVVFLGETKDLSSQIGDGYMSDLDLIDSAHQLTLDNLEDSWLDFGDANLLVDGAVRYIVADRGYEYDDDGNQLPVPGQTNPSEVSVDNSACSNCDQQHDNAFTKNNHPLFISQFTPIVQVKYLIDKIFEQTNYSYTSDSIFNENWFQYLYTDGIGTGLAYTPNQDGRFLAGDSNIYPAPDGDPVIPQLVAYNNANAYSTVTGKYTIPTTGNYQFNIECDGYADNDGEQGQPPPSATIYIYRNNTPFYTDTDTGGQGSVNFSFSHTWSGTYNAGDEIYYVTEFDDIDFAPVITETRFEAISTPLQIAVNDLMKTDLKQIDFLKSVLTKFRCVLVPTIQDATQFRVQPWEDYIASGEDFDWTYKLDRNKDIKMEPLFYDQKADITFTDQEDIDKTNKYHQDTYGDVYGTRRFVSNNELLSDSSEVTTEFAPTPVSRIEGGPSGSNFIIPKFFEIGDAPINSGHDHPQHQPIVPVARLLYWNGLRPTKTITGTDEITWKYTDGSTNKDSSDAPLYDATDGDRYPCASYLSEIPTTTTTLNLSWERKFAYFEFDGGPQGDTGESVYERYWRTYINNIYSSEARKMTAYFNLTSEDMRTLTFDDVIFIKDSYWRIQKVFDAPLGEIATVKVELIKLLSYVRPISYDPLGDSDVVTPSDEVVYARTEQFDPATPGQSYSASDYESSSQAPAS